MVRTFFFIAILVISAQSCFYLGGKRVRGNGNVEIEQRNVSAFEEVEVHGAMDVMVSQSDERSVKVEADENLMKYIEVSQEGNTIVIGTKRGYNLRPSNKMRVFVSSPSYTRLDVSGACNIITQNKISGDEPISLEMSGAGKIKADVDAPKVSASISGSGSVEMTGETKDFDLHLSGAGKARCFGMKSENTSVDISGAGSAEVYASVNLDAGVSGAGSVKYRGNAGNVKQNVSGAGSVKKAD